MNKFMKVAFVATVLLVAATRAHAQGGCEDSPENPTVVLALLGAASAFYTSARARMHKR